MMSFGTNIELHTAHLPLVTIFASNSSRIVFSNEPCYEGYNQAKESRIAARSAGQLRHGQESRRREASCEAAIEPTKAEERIVQNCRGSDTVSIISEKNMLADVGVVSHV